MLFQKLLGAVSKPPASITHTYFTPATFPNFSSGTITLTSVPIGTAATDRIVAVYLATSASSGSSTRITSVTIAGITASLAVENSPLGIRSNSIWYAVVPSGTTANIVANHSIADATNPLFLAVSAIYNTTSTTPITGTSSTQGTGVSPSLSVSITPSQGSVLFAGYSSAANAAGTTASWTNASEQSDQLSGAVMGTSATATGLNNSSITITATGTDSVVNNTIMAVATWA